MSIGPLPLSCGGSCSLATTILASAISIFITALLATVIFVTVQIVASKFYPYKFTPGGAESAASAGGEAPAVYKWVDEGEGSPTLMEIEEAFLG